MNKTVYTTQHFISFQRCKDLALGFNTRLLQSSQFDPSLGEPMVYGILRGNWDIMEYCKNNELNYWYHDHSYFSKSRNQYFRIVKNGRYRTGLKKNAPPDRFNKLNITIKEWHSGTDIIVCPLSKHVAAHRNVSSDAILQQMLSAVVKLAPTKNVFVKPKEDQAVPLEEIFKDAHALVTVDSMIALDAIINGVPAYTSIDNAAYPLSSINLEYIIEEPAYSNREQHLYNLAYQQFTVDEIKDGTAASIIEEYYE